MDLGKQETRIFFLTERDPSKLGKTRSVLNRCHDYTVQTKGQVQLVYWPFAAHIYAHCVVRYVLICYLNKYTYWYYKNIIQCCFQDNWKLNNNYSNSNIQYKKNVFNILNEEIKEKPKYCL